MAKGIHKGSELRNVSETWDENERKRQGDRAPGRDEAPEDASGGDNLQQVIKEEAAEYDQDNKEDKLLGGERASVNDDAGDRPAAL